MLVRNKFIIILNKKFADKEFGEREKRIQRILSSVDKTNILTPLDDIDDDYYDFEFHQQSEIDSVILAEPDKPSLSPFTSSTTRFGRTPLHESIAMGDTEAVKSYLEQGLYLKDKDNNGNSPLVLAKLEENDEILEIFREYGYE